MIYRYLVTFEVERDLNKNFPLDARVKKSIKRHLEDPKPLEGSNDVEFICDNLFKESDQTPSGPRYLWFKEVRNDVCIYVLRKVYLHDEYLRKLNPAKRKSWVERHHYSEEEYIELDKLFAELAIEETREPLPVEFRKYEERPRRFEQNREVLIFELPEWVDGYNELDDRYKQGVFDELSNIIVNSGKIPQPDQYGFFHLYSNGYDIVFRIEAGELSTYAFYLLQLSKDSNLETLLGLNYNCEEIKTLRHKSSKCYPAFIVIDYDTWLAVEDDNQANLALSSEELAILQDIEYPFYVSGLAGSGKSTILYYLFAHIYDYVSHKYPEHKLLFLSYSRKLVANAQSIVKSILQHHPSYNREFTDKVQEMAFNNSFQPFQEFIKKEFLESAEFDVFSQDKYIDYRDFKKKYELCQLPEKKRYSSDIVWSVIRTYIKGKKCDSPFTPEDYASEALSEKDRTVTVADYRQIYRIWESWYKKYFEKGEGWDDLDLVRHAMMKKDAEKHFHKYAVVFCDEAQDFTKLETDLLLRLSVHSKYDLSQSDEDEKIPIAFAGDPNQTINPTGFRWGSTQETVTNSFKEALGKFRGMDAKPLKTNYRSREGIVKFANTIQYIRHQFLMGEKQKLSLQKAWDSEGDTLQDNDGLRYVAFFSIDKYQDLIAEGLQKAVIITADEGEYIMEEKTTAEGHQTESKNNSKDKSDNESSRSNYTTERKKALGIAEDVDSSRLYTAITAKGLEFKAAILYKYSSDPAMFLFEDMIIGGKELEESDKYKLSHFFTKLYIAISRAKQVLFIVDTDESYEKFWKYFIDKNLWEKFIHQYLGKNEIVTDLGKVSLGDINEYALRLEKNYHPKEYAESLFRSAIDDGDRDVMDRARSAFKEAKYYDRATLCEAYLCRYDHKYSESGKRFLKLKKNQEAIESFWEGKCWNELNEALQDMAVPNSKEETYQAYRTICLFMTNKVDCVGFINRWYDNEIAFQCIIADDSNVDLLITIMTKLKQEIASIKTIAITADLLRNLDYLSKYFEFYENGMADLRAQLHFARAEFVNKGKEIPDKAEYEAAVKLWERGDEKPTPTSREYYKAKKLTCGSISEKIVWMSFLGETDEILKQYSETRIADMLTDEAQGIVFAALANSDYEKALDYPYPKDLRSKWQRLYSIDPHKYICSVVLNDFTEEKFGFLAEKVAKSTSKLVLSKEIIDKIFTQNGFDSNKQPHWTYFVGLKDVEGNHAFISEANVTFALDSLSERIMAKDIYDKTLATCFLELLFSKLYNYPRAEKYRNTIIRIFSRDVFFKEDFRGSTGRNKYFTSYVELENDDLDHIKDNIRKYVTEYFKSNSFKKISTNTVGDSKAFFRAFEISAAYQGTTPDYQSICNLYKRLINDKRFALIKDWMKQRLEFNQFLDEATLNRASYSKYAQSISHLGMSINTVIEEFSHEDASAFVAYVNTIDEEYSFDAMFTSSLLIYKHHIRRDDLKPYCIVKDLVAKLPDSIDTAIAEVLSDKKRVDEYAIKLLTYTWESLYDHPFVANHYDELISNKRLSRLRILTEYLKKRALLHFSYLKERLFEDKQDEYGIKMTKSYLPTAYPKIEKKSKGSNDIGTFAPPVTRLPIDDKGQSQVTEEHAKSTSRGKKERRKGELTDNIVDPAKKKAMEIGRNAKNMGMPDDMIMQLTGLSLDDIKKL